MSCPTAIGVRSTSIGAPAAIVEASGFIWEINGHAVNTVPTAAAAPVATKRKSRRVGSAEDAVVTIPNPFLAAAGRTAPGNAQTNRRRLPAPATPAAAERPLVPANRAEQAVQNRSIGTLAGRAQARYRLASVQCTKSAADDDLFRHFMGTSWGRHRMQIALFQPDIPQNTGTILRLCACLNVAAHIIEPAGFPVSDRHFRRAGMDYLDQVTLMRHDSWPKFEQWRNDERHRLILFTTKGFSRYLDFRYSADDILLFGRESAGVPDEVAAAADARLVIPIKPGLRSLNIAMAAAMALGEALRQTGSHG